MWWSHARNTWVDREPEYQVEVYESEVAGELIYTAILVLPDLHNTPILASGRNLKEALTLLVKRL